MFLAQACGLRLRNEKIDPHLLDSGDTYRSTSAIHWRYLWAVMYYILDAPLYPHVLYIGGTHRAVVYCIVGVPLDPLILYIGSTLGSSSTA
jgi:hypothetical protein